MPDHPRIPPSIILLLLAVPGQAVAEQDPETFANKKRVQAAVDVIFAENVDCEVDVSQFGSIQDESAATERFQVWTYHTAGCHRGNNWNGHFGVFQNTPTGIKKIDIKKRIPGIRGISQILGADFNDKRAVIYVSGWKDSDGHCCPTQGVSVGLSVNRGVVQVKTLRMWNIKPPE